MTKPAKKKTSSRVAKIAAKWLELDDEGLAAIAIEEAWGPNGSSPRWKTFCRNLRSIAASALSQVEEKKKR